MKQMHTVPEIPMKTFGNLQGFYRSPIPLYFLPKSEAVDPCTMRQIEYCCGNNSDASHNRDDGNNDK